MSSEPNTVERTKPRPRIVTHTLIDCGDDGFVIGFTSEHFFANPGDEKYVVIYTHAKHRDHDEQRGEVEDWKIQQVIEYDRNNCERENDAAENREYQSERSEMPISV